MAENKRNCSHARQLMFAPPISNLVLFAMKIKQHWSIYRENMMGEGV